MTFFFRFCRRCQPFRHGRRNTGSSLIIIFIDQFQEFFGIKQHPLQDGQILFRKRDISAVIFQHPPDACLRPLRLFKIPSEVMGQIHQGQVTAAFIETAHKDPAFFAQPQGLSLIGIVAVPFLDLLQQES